jgi:hypothetical protein
LSRSKLNLNQTEYLRQNWFCHDCKNEL